MHGFHSMLCYFHPKDLSNFPDTLLSHNLSHSVPSPSSILFLACFLFLSCFLSPLSVSFLFPILSLLCPVFSQSIFCMFSLDGEFCSLLPLTLAFSFSSLSFSYLLFLSPTMFLPSLCYPCSLSLSPLISHIHLSRRISG